MINSNEIFLQEIREIIKEEKLENPSIHIKPIIKFYNGSAITHVDAIIERSYGKGEIACVTIRDTFETFNSKDNKNHHGMIARECILFINDVKNMLQKQIPCSNCFSRLD